MNFQVRLPSGRKSAVSALARLVPATAWEIRSCGPGCKGHRDYDWAWAATASAQHWILIRRSRSDPTDLAFFYCPVRPLPPAPLPPAADAIPAGACTQPADWADTGTLPANTDQPPPAEIGMVKVSVPEARRLLRLATAPMTAATRQFGYTWSRWRRRHQARARYHHYQARMRAAPI